MFGLEKQFNIIACEDLGNLLNDQFSTYQFFYKYYKEAYEPNERIVLYTKYELVDDQLDYLYKVVAEVDISLAFIAIVTPNEVNNEVFNFIQYPILDSAQLTYIKFSDTLCPMPWFHLHVNNQENISPCCISNTNLGNIKEISLKDAFNSNAMNTIRHQMENNEWPIGCKKCKHIESNNSQSMRSELFKFHRKDFFTRYSNNLEIRSLDLKPGNLCNFKCRICSHTASSVIATESNKFFNTNFKVYNRWEDTTSSEFKDLLDVLPNIEHLDLYGGEPFLNKSLTSLVKNAVFNNYAKNIRLHYNTNGSIFNEELVSLWSNFKEVNLQFSIDDIGKRFEYERSGGEWDNVVSNIKKFKALQLPNLTLNIMPAVSVLNVYYFDELCEWADSVGLSISYPIIVTHPEELSFNRLTKLAKNAILKKFENSNYTFIDLIKNSKTSDSVRFNDYIRKYDMIRKEDFSITHPEIANLMGYTLDVT
jgi:MoaA/NifB/PqqE/SkfB family radical SAM enzyme